MSSRGSRSAWIHAAILAAGAAGVGLAQGAVAERHLRVKETSDVYVLPPPRQVVTLSLGYRAALADVLWAQVLVSSGLHLKDKRRYEHVTLYLDTINELAPDFRDPYLMADALITFQAGETPHEELVKARQIMERGIQNRPLDAELWLVLGQFTAFIAPAGYLKDPAEIEQWRQDGARYMAHAGELAGDNASFGWQAVAGAGILDRAGERDAATRFLQRELAVTDDEELRAHIQASLDKLLGEALNERIKRQQAAFRAIRDADLPWVSKNVELVLGPPLDVAFCAGPAHADDVRCARTWREWSERIDRSAPPR